MDLMLIDLLESSKAIGLCPMGNKVVLHYKKLIAGCSKNY